MKEQILAAVAANQIWILLIVLVSLFSLVVRLYTWQLGEPKNKK